MRDQTKKNLIAEFVGTAVLVFVGTAAIVVNDLSGGRVTELGIAIVFGLAVGSMIMTFGRISGAHINPAVTIALWLARQFPRAAVLPYIGSQILGAISGSALVYLFFWEHPTFGATLPAGGVATAFGLEILLTFILVLAIFLVTRITHQKVPVTSLVVGSIVALEAFLAGPITGASMNPARSIGPALLSGQIQHLWLYIAAPVIGAALAVIGCRLIKNKGCCA